LRRRRGTKLPNWSKITGVGGAGTAIAAFLPWQGCHPTPRSLQRGAVMNYLHDHPHASRVLLAALAAMALLVAMSAAAASEPVTSEQFAPGWQSDARPLYRAGIQHMTGRDKYYVPSILPRGDYVLIKRIGDKAVLLDYHFSVTSDNVEQYVFLDPVYGGNLEAMPVRDVPSLAQPRQRGLR